MLAVAVVLVGELVQDCGLRRTHQVSWLAAYTRPTVLHQHPIRLDAEVRHLAFDDSGVCAQPARWEQFEDDLVAGPRVRGVEDVRGKNPGGTPYYGGPPAGCG